MDKARVTEGQADVFIAGVGTGGTLTGVGQVLREKNPNPTVVAVEPETSPVPSGGEPGPHAIQASERVFVPEVLDTRINDRIFPVSSEAARGTARRLARAEGIRACRSPSCSVANGRRRVCIRTFIDADRLRIPHILVAKG
ncbi:pyridoxal-phosphate dependent enzyme [Streptomyces luteolifulvus]|uniref:pyridoxal-phosphate dependent enzyme n=1 Tax=Streptomyces luteolifulvus TaxID=2615112 RepID=UPI001CD9CF69|nr:pyridoxal-phosphate dependent enzyme [Streptomyces luteolifulvus]